MSAGPSRAPLLPTSPYPPAPLGATTASKRPFQGSPDPHRRRPPPKFTNHAEPVSPFIPECSGDDTTLEPELHVPAIKTGLDLRRSFHLIQLKRSSLYLEKCLVFQRIMEHEMSPQILKDRLLDIEKVIADTTLPVGSLHYYMDKVGVHP
ncbi:hypothetical protein EI94DRAFT_1715594 [Lactarius quietus]|nr:hypothetical protein EI94DRAFT_1715594 [Lactarius quietus]